MPKSELLCTNIVSHVSACIIVKRKAFVMVCDIDNALASESVMLCRALIRSAM